MPDISVVVPTYNRADLICDTLDAILAQSLPAAEIIVVDDGSQDDTQAVLSRFGERVRCIRLANSGELVARNTGVLAARHSLVAFCDSDDLWEPDFLATMSWQFAAHPPLLACYADFSIFGPGIEGGTSKFDAAPAGYWSGLRHTGGCSGLFDAPVVEQLLRFQPFFPSCMMVSRPAFLAAGGWDEGVSRIIGCDFATVLRVAMRPPLGVVRQPLVRIRKHPGNFSGDCERMELGDARVLEHVLLTRPELAPFGEAIRASIARRRLAALDAAFVRRDFGTVREISQLIPLHRRRAKQRVKSAISVLPSPLNGLAATLLSR